MKVALAIGGGIVALVLGVWGVKHLTGKQVKSKAAVVQRPGQGGTPIVGQALPGTAGTSADVANYSAAGANAAIAAAQLKNLWGSSSTADDPPQPAADDADPDDYDEDGTEPTDDWTSTADDFQFDDQGV